MEILAIIFVNLLTYYKTFDFGLIVDDIRHAEDIKNGYLKDLGIFEHIRRRFYGVGTLFGRGINNRDEHIFTTVLHTLICVLIYKAFGSNEVSFWASILYAVNPANNQTAIWLNGRRYAVNIIIVLLMMMSWWFWPLYFLTPMFQVNAIFSPILIGQWWMLAVVMVFGGQKIIDQYRIRQAKCPYDLRREYSWKRLVVVVKTFGFYCTQMLIPRDCKFYYRTMYYWGMTDEGNKDAYRLGQDFYVGLFSLFSIFVCGFIVPSVYKGFLVFMTLSILQWSNIVTATQTLADRYMSLPNVFMMFFLSYFASLTPVYSYLMLGISVLYYAWNKNAQRMYENIESFYDYHIYHDPQGVSARAFKASDAMLNKDWISAYQISRAGLKYSPDDFRLLYQCALSCYQLNPANKEATLEYLNKAERNIYFGDKRLPELVRKLREHVKK
jgi:hypothetical protein